MRSIVKGRAMNSVSSQHFIEPHSQRNIPAEARGALEAPGLANWFRRSAAG